MSYEPRQGLLKQQILTATDLQAIRQLAEACERDEQLHMRIEWTWLQQQVGRVTQDLFYYQDGLLVGYLTGATGASQNELVGMVHPNYRRQGIFQALLTVAKEDAHARGERQLILTCEHHAHTGQAFVRSVGATLSESEHEMHLAQLPPRKGFEPQLVVHRAERSESDAIVLVQSESFGSEQEQTRERVAQCFDLVDRPYYLAVFGEGEVSCLEPIGCFRLDEGNDAIGIYGFGVRPAYQGRGYGRQILEDAIEIIRAQSQKKIILDVETENSPASHLYRSCGFEIYTTYDYFVLEL